MAISDWFKNLFKASAWQGTVASDEKPLPHVRETTAHEDVRRGMEDVAAGRVSPLTTAEWKTIRDACFSENFEAREVACRDAARTMPEGEALANAKLAAAMMEDIRAYLGNRPIAVNSWFRSVLYNRQVGGAKNSYHTKGMAVDFTVEGLTPKQVQQRLIKARDTGKLSIGGIGCYASFTHCDIGPKRTWEG